MVHITPGFTWSDTDGLVNSTMTPDNLHTLVDGAVVTGITLGEWDTDAKLVQVSASEPAANQGENSLWWDTTNNYLRKLRSSSWDAIDVGPALTNSSGTNLLTGMAASVDQSAVDRMGATVTAGYIVLGLAQTQIDDGSEGAVLMKGQGVALCIGPVTIGDHLAHQSEGHLTPSQNVTDVSLGELPQIGHSCAQALSSLGTVTGLVNVVIFGH